MKTYPTYSQHIFLWFHIFSCRFNSKLNFFFFSLKQLIELHAYCRHYLRYMYFRMYVCDRSNTQSWIKNRLCSYKVVCNKHICIQWYILYISVYITQLKYTIPLRKSARFLFPKRKSICRGQAKWNRFDGNWSVADSLNVIL